LETFTALKSLADNSNFEFQRWEALNAVNINAIDPPLRSMIKDLNRLPYCFSLQCCYGHFVYAHQPDKRGLDPLPVLEDIGQVRYRIAYLALGVDASDKGRDLLADLGRIVDIDPDYVQFGCAEWFWGRQINTYALQVEPARFMYKDEAFIDYEEALHIEKVRNEFFRQLNELIQRRLGGR